MSNLITKALAVLLLVGSIASAEDVIWNSRPSLPGIEVPNRVINMIGPGTDESRDYLLAQVLVDAAHGNPGIVDIMTTFFLDDAPVGFGTITGQASLNVFVVQNANDLPFPGDNPDDGFIVDVVITQNPAEGWIEVRAENLAALPVPIEIQPGERYFIGLTPIFFVGNEPFGGLALCNTAGKAMEDQSAFRSTAPMFDDWFFAGDLFGPPELFASTVVEPLRLGDVNCDAKVDLLDVAPFVELLTNGLFSHKADLNQDGVLDALDIAPFIDRLIGS